MTLRDWLKHGRYDFITIAPAPLPPDAFPGYRETMANYTKRDQRRADLHDELQGKPLKATRLVCCTCGDQAVYELNDGFHPPKLYCTICVPKDALK